MSTDISDYFSRCQLTTFPNLCLEYYINDSKTTSHQEMSYKIILDGIFLGIHIGCDPMSHRDTLFFSRVTLKNSNFLSHRVFIQIPINPEYYLTTTKIFSKTENNIQIRLCFVLSYPE